MNCKPDAIKLMHTYLDGDLTQEEESQLLSHLTSCKSCQKYFHELKRTIQEIQHIELIDVPDDFTTNVMNQLPEEKRRTKYMYWTKKHPVMISAAVLFVFLFSGVFSLWNQDGKLVVSKQDDLIIEGDTVIVPKDVTVDGDLVVKNGKLRIEGTVDGNVTLVKSTLITEETDLDGITATSSVSGEMKQVNQAFDWIWFNIKQTAKGIFTLQLAINETISFESDFID